MVIKRYEDINYDIIVSEEIYNHFRNDAEHIAIVYGDNGKAAIKHDIERAYFRFKNLGRKPEQELEIVARTLVFEEMF